MKKLVLLALVLGMASAAGAALTWSTNAITLNLGQSMTLQIASDSADPYPRGPAWVGAEPSPTGVAQITGIAALPAAGGNPVIQNPATTTYPGWWTISAIDTEEPFTITTGNQWDLTVQGLVAGTYVIGLDTYGSANNQVPGPNLTVTVLPEPITIALLGLGGLFLRRKK